MVDELGWYISFLALNETFHEPFITAAIIDRLIRTSTLFT